MKISLFPVQWHDCLGVFLRCERQLIIPHNCRCRILMHLPESFFFLLHIWNLSIPRQELFQESPRSPLYKIVKLRAEKLILISELATRCCKLLFLVTSSKKKKDLFYFFLFKFFLK